MLLQELQPIFFHQCYKEPHKTILQPTTQKSQKSIFSIIIFFKI